jgi:DNA-binding MarR family transcriptional regulator
MSLLYHLFVLNQHVRALLNRAMADSPLRPDEYAVYSLLWESGPLSPTDMARGLGMPLTTMSDYARTMLERGHAERSDHPTDSRSHLLRITAAGTRVHRIANRRFEEAMSRVARILEVPEEDARAVLLDLARASKLALQELEAGP